MTYTLHCGDCLDILPTLPSGSIDAVITDPPYGTTACKWDSVIPLEAMWRELKRVIKSRGAVVLFAAQPFTSALVMSNAGWFRYELIWDKVAVVGVGSAKRMPLKTHENMLVFYDGQPTYNPELGEASKPFGRLSPTGSATNGALGTNRQCGVGYPKSIIRQMRPNNLTGGGLHPTQKPVELLRYLVRTYTNPGETVLDFTMGSGTTGVACAMEGRHFIGVELDAGYFDIAKRRIEQVQPALMEAAD